MKVVELVTLTLLPQKMKQGGGGHGSQIHFILQNMLDTCGRIIHLNLEGSHPYLANSRLLGAAHNADLEGMPMAEQDCLGAGVRLLQAHMRIQDMDRLLVIALMLV